MAETLTLNRHLTFEVRRSDRRSTMSITVDRDGTLLLSLPAHCSLDEGRSFAEEKQFWIFRKLAEKKLFRQPAAPKEYVEGEGHYYLGRSYRLKLVDASSADAAPLRLYRGRWRLRTDYQDDAERLFRDWYIEHAHPYVERRVQRWADRLEVKPSGVCVRPLGYRWGSCTPDGTLNFHWRTVLLPARLIDYVVVHELVHLHEPRHDPAFWRRVERAMPDFERRKRELAEKGGGYF